MKRMNIIRVALFAVVTFMGSVSLSAQNWYGNQQALNVIQGELLTLNTPVRTGVQPGQLTSANSSPAANNAAIDKALKVMFLEQIAQQIKQGVDTGAAVQSVYTSFTQSPGIDSGTRSNRVNQIYLYVVDLLS